MADVNAPSGQAPAMAPPVRTDEQILPRIRGGTGSTQDPTLYSTCLMKSLFLDTSTTSKAEYVPAMEPQVAAEDTNFKKALEESMKTVYALPRGPLPPVVIREPESRKYQPLPEVPGKGKAKVTEEQSDSEEESETVVLEADEVLSQPARKPKSTTTKAPLRPAVTSTQSAPTSTPAEPQAKKRKHATDTSDKPPKAKKYKYGLVRKKRTLKNVATSKAEYVPAMEPQVAAEDTNFKKALEESMKTVYALPRGPLPPVVIREPESRKYQPLPEVPG
nr:hypothetical protein [Tanacetum cinerariifolium]